jgi:hypothetical protein
MKAYSEDLPQKIVEATERGVSKAQAARLCKLSLSSAKRYARGWHAKEALLLLARVLADLRRFTRARSSYSKKMCKNARLPPSLGGAVFWSTSPARV